MQSVREYNKYQLKTLIRLNPGITSEELLNILIEYKMHGHWYQRKISRLLTEMTIIDKAIKYEAVGVKQGIYHKHYYIK